MNVARIVMKAAIALLFLLVGSNAPYLSLSQSESVPTQVELCGVKLRPKVVEIVDQIEHYYKEPVQCELANLDDKGEAGYADATHGIPKIYVDTFTGRQELTIAHELLHIWLGIHGFATNPHVSFDKPNEIDGTRFRSALNIIYSDLFRHVAHAGAPDSRLLQDRSPHGHPCRSGIHTRRPGQPAARTPRLLSPLEVVPDPWCAG
jgi:hypothetical protein